MSGTMKQGGALLIIILLALVSGSLYNRGPMELGLVGNENFYWDTALGLQSADSPAPNLSGVESVIYPHFLSLIAGDEAGAIKKARVLQSRLLLSLLGVLVFFLLQTKLSPAPALAGSLAAVFSAPAVVSAGNLDPSALTAVLAMVGLLLIGLKNTLPFWILGGIFLGLSALSFPAWGWAALLGFVLVVLFSRSKDRAPRYAALVVVAAWVLGAGVAGSALKSGSFVPKLSGYDVMQGHRAEASGLNPRRSSDDKWWWGRKEFSLLANREAESFLKAQELDRAWRNEGVRSALTGPQHGVPRTARKWLAAWQPLPVPREVGPHFLLEQTNGAFLSISMWASRILLPLGLAGLLFAWSRIGTGARVGLLSAPLAFLLTYARPESHLPTALVMAGGFGFLLHELATRFTWWKPVVAIASVGVFGFLAPNILPTFKTSSVDHFFLGNVHDRDGRGSAAMRAYDQALRVDPNNPLPRFALGAMLARDQVSGEATRELETLRDSHPDFYQNLTALAQLYQAANDWPSAIATYQSLLELDPYNPELHNNIGTVFLQAGYFQRAENAFRQALALDPAFQAATDNLEFMKSMGTIASDTNLENPVGAAAAINDKLKQRDLAGARAILEESKKIHGDGNLTIQFVEATLLLQEGRCDESIRILEPMISSMNQNPMFLNNLGASYATCGQTERAIEIWEAALQLMPSNQVIKSSLAQARAELEAKQQKR